MRGDYKRRRARRSERKLEIVEEAVSWRRRLTERWRLLRWMAKLLRR